MKHLEWAKGDGHARKGQRESCVLSAAAVTQESDTGRVMATRLPTPLASRQGTVCPVEVLMKLFVEQLGSFLRTELEIADVWEPQFLMEALRSLAASKREGPVRTGGDTGVHKGSGGHLTPRRPQTVPFFTRSEESSSDTVARNFNMLKHCEPMQVCVGSLGPRCCWCLSYKEG